MSESNYQPPDLALLGEEHIRRYQETAGEVGYLWNGVPTLLLSTTGRRTGEPRTNALIFGRDGDDYLVVASMGGAPQHPQWYLNVTAHPEAEIQVRGDHLRVRAHTAGDDEKARLWQIVTGVWPNYDVYQTRTERVIPVVVLSPE
jgi:deazaflavin-dependent oxidoreductase (nitroreductase family)